MNAAEFNKLFDNYKVSGKSFDQNEWDKALSAWQEYVDLIKQPGGLPIERWLKETNNGYLPDFLSEREKMIGRARIGNYEHVMIYKYSKNSKYRDVYYSKDKSVVLDNISDIQKDYDENISYLLTKLVNANSLQEVYEAERDSRYERFSCKHILRKISILMSVMPGSKYENEFMWVFNEKRINALAEVFDYDIDKNKTFLEKNHDIYNEAKKIAGLDNNSSKDEFVRLYYFLWDLSSPSLNISVLSSFLDNNLIFNGAPGTGKTYGVKNGFDKLHSIDAEKYVEKEYIQFHPSFTYQDFIEGIKPLGIVGGNLDLQVVNGCFKEFCIFVKKENENYYKKLSKKPAIDKPDDFVDWPHYYFIVDEINRGNLSSIFGETFTLLEYRDYDFSGKYDDVKSNLVLTALSSVIQKLGKEDLCYKRINDKVYFGVPFNIHFIGLMNDVDKSIDTFDLALRRRFKWIPKYCDYQVIEDELLNYGYNGVAVEEYIKSCKELNKYICDKKANGLCLGEMYEIGHAFFLKITYGDTKITKNKKKTIFNNYISETLKEYIRQICGENELDDRLNKAREAFGVDK